jgi:hypothetical protein
MSIRADQIVRGMRNESKPPPAFDLAQKGLHPESSLVAPLIKPGEVLSAGQGRIYRVRHTHANEAGRAYTEEHPEINIGSSGEALNLHPLEEEERRAGPDSHQRANLP